MSAITVTQTRNISVAPITPLDLLVNKVGDEVAHAARKWEELGFSKEAVLRDPEGVRFAIETGLAFSVKMFMDASSSLEGDRLEFRLEGNSLLFPVDGGFASLAEIRKHIPYSPKDKRFVGWRVVHPQGFVPQDCFSYGSLRPIGRLKREVFEEIQRSSEAFWSNREEVDPGQEKKFFLQVLTTGRPCLGIPMFKNLDDHTPEHSSARLIDSDGNLYSFGTLLASMEAGALGSLSSIMVTTETGVSSPDYEINRPSAEKRVTTIPITEERFKRISNYVVESAKGFPFNFPTNNCARYVTSLMDIAGVPVDIRMTPGEFLSGAMPSLKDLPMVGPYLDKIASVISLIAKPIFDLIGAVNRWTIPPKVRRFHKVFKPVGSFTDCLKAFFINCFCLVFFGAGRTRVPEGKKYAENRGIPGKSAIPTRTRLVSVDNLFSTEAIVIYHALKLRKWQLEQPTTSVYHHTQNEGQCIRPIRA